MKNLEESQIKKLNATVGYKYTNIGSGTTIVSSHYIRSKEEQKHQSQHR